MLDYTGLQALAAVVREGSFERAARRLHITPSAVSQRIKQLEERTGLVLVLRGTPCTGTDAGRRLCLHVEQVALLENELRRTNPGLMPDGHATPPTLKLAVNADSLSTWFMDAMAAFTQDGNELLDISIDDQDHTAKRLKEGEVMAAAWPGKIKTATQMVAIILLFLDNFPFQAIGIPVADIMLYLCLVFTIYSGVDYFIKNKHVFVGSM